MGNSKASIDELQVSKKSKDMLAKFHKSVLRNFYAGVVGGSASVAYVVFYKNSDEIYWVWETGFGMLAGRLTGIILYISLTASDKYWLRSFWPWTWERDRRRAIKRPTIQSRRQSLSLSAVGSSKPDSINSFQHPWGMDPRSEPLITNRVEYFNNSNEALLADLKDQSTHDSLIEPLGRSLNQGSGPIVYQTTTEGEESFSSNIREKPKRSETESLGGESNPRPID